MKKDIEKNHPTHSGKEISFQSKHEQAVAMITDVASVFSDTDIIVVADSWFGNNGMWKPLQQELGDRIHMISRLRSNNNLFDQPQEIKVRKQGRPRMYGNQLGTTSSIAVDQRKHAHEYKVNLYGRERIVLASDRIVMLKTLKCPVRVVWVYRKTQWVALFTTDLTLSVAEIIEYYGARWKIEACFKELKRDIGSAETQTRNPVAVTNHLDFCMMATSITWIYACSLKKAPSRRHVVKGRGHFAFSDVRRRIAEEALDNNFVILCPPPSKSLLNSFVTTMLRMAA